MSAKPEPLSRAQWGVVFLIAGVQFVNILDFVMVMPLGPAFSEHLGISQASLGLVNGSYTAAAAVTGLLGAFVLDRFDRRPALVLALLGLAVGTAAGGLATGMGSLLVARMVAGAFGGPATSLAFSIIADTIPPQHRGKAMGTVMGAFSIASVLGVPAGLWLGDQVSWRAPFFATGVIGLATAVMAQLKLPSLRGHLAAARRPVATELAGLARQPLVRWSMLLTTTVMVGGFVLIPNIAAYLQLNLGLPPPDLKWAYLLGGLASLVATQSAGRLVDRFGSARVGTAGAALVVVVVYAFFYVPWPHLSSPQVWLGFIGYMLANGVRNVAYNTLTTKVPAPHVRASFQSLQSTVQHGATALAAFGSTLLLSTSGAGAATRLHGMPAVALTSMVLTAFIPVLLLLVERGVRAQAAPVLGP